MGILLFFVDGIGIGPEGAHNPLARSGASLLGVHEGRLEDGRITGLPREWMGVAIDASLGIPGLPQSATGQASLLTGTNAAALLGAHQSALPGRRLRSLVHEQSLLRHLRAAGARVTFANAFRAAMWQSLAPDGRPKRASVSTLAMFASGAPFRDLEDLRNGRAVFHDLTRQSLLAHDPTMATVSIQDAAAHLAAISRAHEFTLFEFFLTDLRGHARLEGSAEDLILAIDDCLTRVASALDPALDGIIATSDHGNLEDLSVTTHTRYPVPLLLWGRAHATEDALPRDLCGVAPLIWSRVTARPWTAPSAGETDA